MRDIVPLTHRAHFDALWQACETIDYCEDLPTVFLPGGCPLQQHHRHPAVIDLGFLLVNADGAPIVAPPEPSDPARVEATIRGYCRHRTPSDTELAHLADAIRFRPLVLACADFKSALKHGRAPERWPLERVQAADELGERAIAALRARPPR